MDSWYSPVAEGEHRVRSVRQVSEGSQQLLPILVCWCEDLLRHERDEAEQVGASAVRHEYDTGS